MSTAYDRIRDALVDHGSQVKEGDRDLMAQCPAHNDGRPSLHVSVGKTGDRAVLNCFAGCADTDVLTALGLAAADLFDADAVYEFADGARVHRGRDRDGKKVFRQSGNKKDRNLFRVEHLPEDRSIPVLVVEGEKDANTAAYLDDGVFAVSPRQGASTEPNRFDWSPLKGRPVMIVADNDDAGIAHAHKVADLLANVAGSVRLVRAAEGKDFTDHVMCGHGVGELVQLDAVPEHLTDLDGAVVLDEVEAFMGQYLHLPSRHALTVLTLWAAHTWASSVFYVTPRLVLDSPGPGSGKTRVLELLALLCHGAKLTLSTTTAALYRRIASAEGDPPTVLQDEADAIWGRNTSPQAEDLRALFNAGYKAGATVDRCEGDSKNMKVVEFPVFAPVALAGLAGRMPATITTRAVTIHMRRRAPGEHVAEFRERDANAEASPLREMLATWVGAHRTDLADARPSMPDGVRDRPAEVWETLLAVADVAGGQWPDKARAACRHFVLDSDPDELSLGARLLRDIREVFAERDAMWSVDLITDLTDGDESEWADLWGKPLDQRRLAREMKKYGVKSREIRIGGTTKKGYRTDGPDGLAQAWERYLPADPSLSATSATSATSQVKALRTVADDPSERNKRNTSATPQTGSDQGQRRTVADVADVAHKDGFSRPQHVIPPDQRAALGRCRHCEWHMETQGHAPNCPEHHRPDTEEN
ncbi:DUF3631 domain-containing protein [uncultured Gordonia sp.]|uniref:DUF3631 domain-containing protein n=1 Tax=uncultured Gordonia sp. TaxID=198437 RepID=UPI00258DA930|nr:DUF3631 domain-containing protein [uncultured Gordonia sp.]